uniref:Uncharacterized protein n=1 Tax=Anguilla anguilla TaxID=7936 RepID=A0A0E9TW85_ANGAN
MNIKLFDWFTLQTSFENKTQAKSLVLEHRI